MKVKDIWDKLVIIFQEDVQIKCGSKTAYDYKANGDIHNHVPYNKPSHYH